MKVLVVVEGGCVRGVSSTDPGTSVEVVDIDDLRESLSRSMAEDVAYLRLKEYPYEVY